MNYNREQALMNRLRIKGRMELTEVVNYLQISESTARRLFSRLETEGKLIRVHGGIQLSGKNPIAFFSSICVCTICSKEYSNGFLPESCIPQIGRAHV